MTRMTQPVEFDIHLDPDPIAGIPRPAWVEIQAADLGIIEGLDPASIEVRYADTSESVSCRWEDLEVLPDPFDDLQGYWPEGDRLYTEIRMGIDTGMDTALVLTVVVGGPHL